MRCCDDLGCLVYHGQLALVLFAGEFFQAVVGLIHLPQKFSHFCVDEGLGFFLAEIIDIFCRVIRRVAYIFDGIGGTPGL